MAKPRALTVAGRAAGVALVLMFGLQTPAFAAMWVRISLDPSTPSAGDSVNVSVLTFSATQNLCWDDPRITPIPEATWYGGGDTPVDLALELVVSTSSDRFTVPLVQRPGAGAYWDGKMVFPSGGEWHLYAKRAGAAANASSADQCAGFVRTVDVQPMPAASPRTTSLAAAAEPNGPSNLWIVGALVLALAAAGLGVAAGFRHRRP
jgi:hypothetical protein